MLGQFNVIFRPLVLRKLLVDLNIPFDSFVQFSHRWFSIVDSRKLLTFKNPSNRFLESELNYRTIQRSNYLVMKLFHNRPFVVNIINIKSEFINNCCTSYHLLLFDILSMD